jgi:hypothetical protein
VNLHSIVLCASALTACTIDAPHYIMTSADGGMSDGMPGDSGIDAAPDLDADDDTIPDADDNCPERSNLDQHDEDTDDVGDVCDNCPHVVNTGQANTTEPINVTSDQVGDACDPHPTTADVIAMFDPFSGTGAPTGWTSLQGTWTKSGDQLSQTSLDVTAYLFRVGLSGTDLVTETSVDVDSVPSGGTTYRSIGSVVFFNEDGAGASGYLCLIFDDLGDANQAVVHESRIVGTGATSGTSTSPELGFTLSAGQNHVMRNSANGTTTVCSRANGTPVSLTSADSTFASGGFALRTTRVGASFRYAIAFEPAP